MKNNFFLILLVGISAHLVLSPSIVSAQEVTDKFTGQEQDANGLYYYGSRYYDPDLGRFTQPDSITPSLTSQGLNPYSYVNNNPVNFTDPTGYQAVFAPEDLANQDVKVTSVKDIDNYSFDWLGISSASLWLSADNLNTSSNPNLHFMLGTDYFYDFPENTKIATLSNMVDIERTFRSGYSLTKATGISMSPTMPEMSFTLQLEVTDPAIIELFDIVEAALVYKKSSGVFDASPEYIIKNSGKRVVALGGNLVYWEGKTMYVVDFEKNQYYVGQDIKAYDKQIYLVPAKGFFLVGDNYDHSYDSRYPGVGPAPYSAVYSRFLLSLDMTKNGLIDLRNSESPNINGPFDGMPSNFPSKEYYNLTH